jgi:MFS family permease
VTTCITAAAAMVALAAAVRSTWSPCGLSMLSTITPLSERARGHRYRSTATWFIVGAVVGGATLGSVLALLAVGVLSLHLSSTALGAVALGATVVAAGSDAGVGGRRLPVHRRQVNERWLDQYRPWVYGAGFGWQIGNGLSTYITTAAVYLMVVLGALTGDPVTALALGAGFGLVRGLAVLMTRPLTDPVRLRAFHRRFTAVGPVVGRAVIAVELGASAVLAVWLGSLPALVLTVGAMGVTTAAVLSTRRGAPDAVESGDPLGPVVPVPRG